MGKLKERLRNPPFDLRLAVLYARNDEHKRELKAAKHKWRVAWALRDERFEELYDFEQTLLDDGTHDAAGIQVLSAAHTQVSPLFSPRTHTRVGRSTARTIRA